MCVRKIISFHILENLALKRYILLIIVAIFLDELFKNSFFAYLYTFQPIIDTHRNETNNTL